MHRTHRRIYVFQRDNSTDMKNQVSAGKGHALLPNPAIFILDVLIMSAHRAACQGKKQRRPKGRRAAGLDFWVPLRKASFVPDVKPTVRHSHNKGRAPTPTMSGLEIALHVGSFAAQARAAHVPGNAEHFAFLHMV